MKPKNQNAVEKALSQEAQTILSNIQALAQELLTSEGQAGATAEAGMTGAPPQQEPEQITTVGKEAAGSGETEPETPGETEPEKPGEKEPEKVKKDQTTTSSDVATARDDALARIEDTISEVDEENVEEVKKAFRALKAQAQARKSTNLPVLKAMNDLANVMKGIVANQNELGKAVGLILEGSGITKQIEEAIKVEKSSIGRSPIMTQDNDKLVNFLQTIQKSISGQPVQTDSHNAATGDNARRVSKNLETAVTTLMAGKK